MSSWPKTALHDAFWLRVHDNEVIAEVITLGRNHLGVNQALTDLWLLCRTIQR